MKKLLLFLLLFFPAIAGISQSSPNVSPCTCGESEAGELLKNGKMALYMFGHDRDIFDGLTKQLTEKGIEVMGLSPVATEKMICFNNLILEAIMNEKGNNFFSTLNKEAVLNYPYRRAQPKSILNRFFVGFSRAYKNRFEGTRYGTIKLYLTIGTDGRIDKAYILAGEDDKTNDFTIEYVKNGLSPCSG